TIDGIGGIGKSALALEIAHRYLRNYDQIPLEERFEAIIWTSAKQTVLTAEGIVPRRQVLRTLDDIYTAIAVSLQREDITRARPEEQDEVVGNALMQQRTLLIVDNLETVDDEAVMNFLRELPAPTKAIVTTRHRIDVAYPVRLVGMPWEDAQELIAQECEKKGVSLNDDEIHRLYDRTGGVPLAIVWSIAQMGFGYGVESVLTRLGQPSNDIAHFCFEKAMGGIRGKPAHKILVTISLFTFEASREDLGYVAGLPDLDRDEGLVELEKLSLVNRKGSKYNILPLTKRYVLQDFESGESGLNYWDFLVNDGPRLVEITLKAGNLEKQADIALWRVGQMLIMRGEYDRAKTMISQIEAVAADQGLKQVQADVWFLFALLYREMQQYSEALQWFEKAEKFYHKEENYSVLMLSAILNRKADALRRQGDFEQAKKCISDALKLLDKPSVKDPLQRLERKTLLWGDLGFIFSREGNYKKAKKYIDKCVENLESLTKLRQNDAVMAVVYIEKAVLAYHLQDHKEANEWAIKAEDRIRRSGIKRPICDGDEEWLHITEQSKAQ
ncbi:MAG: hypothetical protein GY792_21445, partial [Gammaproteobacteria bacterium]|nr:hypothetical protein [Gammaproteobacteria bacterium]